MTKNKVALTITIDRDIREYYRNNKHINYSEEINFLVREKHLNEKTRLLDACIKKKAEMEAKIDELHNEIEKDKEDYAKLKEKAGKEFYIIRGEISKRNLTYPYILTEKQWKMRFGTYFKNITLEEYKRIFLAEYEKRGDWED
jgi:hypothetical protein